MWDKWGSSNPGKSSPLSRGDYHVVIAEQGESEDGCHSGSDVLFAVRGAQRKKPDEEA